MTEKHLGDGRVLIYRDEERYCTWTRHGIAHPDHVWRYARTDALTGEIQTGEITCDGLPEDEAGRPFPLPPFDIAERAKAVDTLLGLWNSLPFGHPERQGVMRAIEVLRSEDPSRTD